LQAHLSSFPHSISHSNQPKPPPISLKVTSLFCDIVTPLSPSRLFFIVFLFLANYSSIFFIVIIISARKHTITT
jgi:hypothetical protein